MLKSTPPPTHPKTSKNRSWSSILELNQDTSRIHPWFKFGPNTINICSFISYHMQLIICISIILTLKTVKLDETMGY